MDRRTFLCIAAAGGIALLRPVPTFGRRAKQARQELRHNMPPGWEPPYGKCLACESEHVDHTNCRWQRREDGGGQAGPWRPVKFEDQVPGDIVIMNGNVFQVQGLPVPLCPGDNWGVPVSVISSGTFRDVPVGRTF